MEKKPIPKSAKDIDIDQYAYDIVESWDMDTLFNYAVDQLTEAMQATPQDQLLEEYIEFYDLTEE